ncbi:MAG: Cys-tRNA(Pro) deacylase [Rhodothermaceae bacterium]
MAKTNAVRLLEAQKIKYDTVEYEFNEEEIDAVSVARKIGEEPEIVFKTLVATGDKTGHIVFVIPGNYDLDLKKAAKASGNKKVELIKLKDLQPLTGYIRGGCSPIGMKKLFPTYIDETAELYDELFCSAGVRGMQLKIDPQELKNIINARFCELI